MTGSSASPFDQSERYLAERASTDLPTLHLADTVSHTLGLVLQAFQLPYFDGDDPSDEWVQSKALIYLGLLAGRSLRAVMLLAEHGYDVEALAFKRRLVEIHARTARIVDPDHGPQRARDWLDGRDRKPSAVVDLPEGAWANYSHVVHADYRAAEHHLVQRHDDGRVNFTLLPARDTDRANATLAMSAAETRDVAVEISVFKSLRINGLDALDKAVRDGLNRWVVPDAEGDGSDE